MYQYQFTIFKVARGNKSHFFHKHLTSFLLNQIIHLSEVQELYRKLKKTIIFDTKNQFT